MAAMLYQTDLKWNGFDVLQRIAKAFLLLVDLQTVFDNRSTFIKLINRSNELIEASIQMQHIRLQVADATVVVQEAGN